jgi:hypothetical protein
MLIEDPENGNAQSELAALVTSTEDWLRRLQASFEEWRQLQESQDAGADPWQQVLRWYTAFDLGFAQLAQCVDDLADVDDARLALAEGGRAIRIDRIRLLPLARQRLRALTPDLRKHLLEVHVRRLFAPDSPPEEERVAGMDDLYRIRAHGCRIVYHRANHGPLVLSVTQVAWPRPLRDEVHSKTAFSPSPSR